MPRHNDLDRIHSLDGAWRFKLGDGPERSIDVPGAWEPATGDYLTEGPATYSRTLELGSEWDGHRIWLDVDAASFAVEVSINGKRVGGHRGMWSPFQIDLTEHWRPGSNTLALEVWKPGRRFPMREALAGFLPDVCTTFGGLWQSLRLRAAPADAVGFHDVRWAVAEDGTVSVRGALHGDVPDGARVALTIGRRRVETQINPDERAFELNLPRALRRRYRADSPSLSEAVLDVQAADGAPLARLSRGSADAGLRPMKPI